MTNLDRDFPYLVVSATGASVARYARAEMALLLCERLGHGATIHAYGVILWEHDAAVWDVAHAGEDDGAEMLTRAVRSVRQQLELLEKD